MAPKGQKSAKGGPRPVATNRRARHDFEILDTFECGIALQGSEVKSIREGKVQMREAYARVDDGEVWVYSMHVAPWAYANGFGAHDPERRRKLLLHRREIEQLAARTAQEGLTLVPLSIYFVDGRAKLELGLARGRKTYDKRHALAERDAAREMSRVVARRGRGED
jgi:SsrA-binding protein